MPENYRPIVLLEIVAKLAASILADKLSRHLEKHKSPLTFGFYRKLGCADAIFTLKQALLKSREHDMDSYVLFLDIVRAFDSVDRDLLMSILAKFGVDAHLIKLVKSLYAEVTIVLKEGDATASFQSEVGVKQGDSLSPILFNYVMEAIIATLNLRQESIKIFRTKEDAVLRGRRVDTTGFDEVQVPYTWYADDGALLFSSREDLLEGTKRIRTHLERFGLTMHVGTPSKRE